MRPNTTAIFAGLKNVIGADCDQPAISNFQLAMKLDEQFSLPAVLGTKTSAAEDKNHGVRSLQFGKLTALRRMVGEFVVGKDGSRNDVRAHGKSSMIGCSWRNR